MDTNRGGRGHGHAGTKPGPTSKPKDPPNNHTTPPQQQKPPATPTVNFAGIGHAFKRLGHTIYNSRTLKAALSLQWEIKGNAARQATFKDFTVNYCQFWLYIAMIGDQKTITMIHTLGMFYSLKQATNAYQGKVLAFIGDRQVTKEPTPICLPQTKARQWFAGKASKDAQSFKAHFANPATQGMWWRSTGETMEIKAPYLLTLPNTLVKIL
jgi:hypothetical protein